MGIPTPGRAHVHGLDLLHKLPPDLMTDRNLKSLSGNGMHAAVVGCLLLCAIKNVQHRHCGDSKPSMAPHLIVESDSD